MSIRADLPGLISPEGDRSSRIAGLNLDLKPVCISISLDYGPYACLKTAMQGSGNCEQGR